VLPARVTGTAGSPGGGRHGSPGLADDRRPVVGGAVLALARRRLRAAQEGDADERREREEKERSHRADTTDLRGDPCGGGVRC